jgi:hypothetical protein
LQGTRGGDVDDDAAGAAQVRGRVLRHQERPGEVGADAAVPLAQVELVHRAAVGAGDAGVVHQRVQPAEAFHHGAHAGARRCLARHVGADEEEIRCAAQVGNGDLPALAGEGERNAAADALRAAGDERHFFRGVQADTS